MSAAGGPVTDKFLLRMSPDVRKDLDTVCATYGLCHLSEGVRMAIRGMASLINSGKADELLTAARNQ